MMPKHLYILRHGNASPYSQTGDAERELTELGIAEAKLSAQSFKARQCPLDTVVVSPYVRAQQTAKTFLAELGGRSQFFTNDLITPAGRVSQVTDWLEQQKSESILLVTHQPFAQDLVEYLTDQVLPLDFAMTTGTLVCIEAEFFAAACCQMSWYISPK
ncbi:phosphohistidine phosphatase SixA [Marinomonas sp. THO17]|uniref:phosphohistidine phosphatase SixA n=1 Tax=Marinomonas sp. THO17 TaxID=3149048 RepID=UPI00336BB584